MAKRILIVDDEEDQRKLVGLLLRDYDCVLEELSDGLRLVEKVREFQPDLILMDYLLPKKNGYELIQEIRKCDDLREIPVIMFTVRRFDDGFKDWIRLDVKEFLQKPVTSRTLIPSIEKAVGFLSKRSLEGRQL